MAASIVTGGLLCAILAAVFNGSFTSLFKTPSMKTLEIHPIVFQLYASCGVFISSWFVVPFLSYNPSLVGGDDVGVVVGDTYQFSLYGVLGGCLFVMAISASFLAVNDIGVALAQGIWGGGAMIVSYLWGYVVFRDIPRHPVSSLCGLILLIVGVCTIAFCDDISERWRRRRSGRMGGGGYYHDDGAPLMGGGGVESINDDGGNDLRNNYTRGVLWACSVGLTGGSVLVPLHYVPPSQGGLVFLPSFGIGALLASPLVFLLYTCCTSNTGGGTGECLDDDVVSPQQPPPLHLRTMAPWYGLLSGLLWNVGNLLSIIAIPLVGYGVAYPIYQAAILVSGLWGIYVFREISDVVTIKVFWIGGTIVILGAIVLSASQ